MAPLDTVIAICWIGFWVYWIVKAASAKRAIAPNLRRFIGIRLSVFILASIVFLLFKWLPQSLKNNFLGDNTLMLALGFIMFLLGLATAVWARIYLGKNWGMPMTQVQKPQLVTTGPYRYIRHPIYTGILLMTFASAIDVNIYWLIIFIVSAIYFIYSAVMEERLMTRQFPKVYPKYKATTKMLIPFIL